MRREGSPTNSNISSIIYSSIFDCVAARHAHIEVLKGRGREDVYDLHHILVIEVPEKADLPNDALGIHEVVESSGNFLDRHLNVKIIVRAAR